MPTAGAAALSLGALLAVGLATTAADPVNEARAGWNQPSASVVAKVADVADRGAPFVLWEWTDLGNERLANFWAALAWDSTRSGVIVNHPPTLPGGLTYWAYFETDVPSQLCDVARAVPGVVVVTRRGHTAKQLESACPRAEARVRVDRDST